MKIENQKLDISEAFTNFVYTVPDYQREYVWREKEVNKLFEDIFEEFSKEKSSETEYFIGTIVVQRNDKNIEVIDGQQRLTTLFLSFCAFIKILEEENTLLVTDSSLHAKNTVNENKKRIEAIQKWLFSSRMDDKGNIVQSYNLVLQYEDTSDLLQHIIKGTIRPDTLKNSSKRIYDAYLFAMQFLKTNVSDRKDLTKFLGYFSNKVKFIQIETPSISDALKTFETINERGVGLNPMDLLKNLIFRQLERKDFEKLKRDWKGIISLLEKNKEKSLRFLRYYIMANYTVKIEKEVSGKKVIREIITEDEIYDWMTGNNNQCQYKEKPFEFVSKMNENVVAYTNFAQGKNKIGDLNVYLTNIKSLGGSLSQHLILLLSAKDLEDELFNYLARQIETLLFYYIITKTPTKELELKFSKWAQEVKNISNLDKNKHKQALNTFILNKLEPEIKEKQNDYKDDFLKFNFYTLQQYRLKYLLAKIAQYLDLGALGQKESEVLDIYLKPKIEIEHILPNKPTDELLKDFEDRYGKDTYSMYKLRLGNLTLLEKPINIVVGRNYFDLKKQEYKKSKFLITKSIAIIENVGKDTSINRINKELKSYEQWGKDTIEDRQLMLYDLSKKIWKIEEMK